MNQTVSYRSPAPAGPGRGSVFVSISPLQGINSFWSLYVGGVYQGLAFMDDFGFVVTVTPATFFSLRNATH